MLNAGCEAEGGPEDCKGESELKIHSETDTAVIFIYTVVIGVGNRQDKCTQDNNKNSGGDGAAAKL